MTMHKNATIITVTPSVNGDLHQLLLLKDDGEELELGAAYSPVVVHRDPRKRLPLWTLQPGTLVNVEAPEHALAGWGIQIVEFSPVLEIEFVYTNYEGETRLRKAVPVALRFEQTEWHGLQMIMVGWDTEKQAERSYALSDCDFTKNDGARRVYELQRLIMKEDGKLLIGLDRKPDKTVEYFIESQRFERGNAFSVAPSLGEAIDRTSKDF